MTSTTGTALRTLAGVAAAGVAGVAYAGLIERNLFTLRHFEVPVLPSGAAPVRILQVSDLHLVPRQQRKIEWVRELASLSPDFVVNSGDNLAAIDAVPALLHAMEPLMDFPGAFVLGSNDRHGPVPKNPARYLTRDHARAPRATRVELPVDDLTEGMREGGWLDLDNARTTTTIGPHRIELVGVDDPHIERDRYAAVSAPASPDVALTLGLVHAPYQRVLDAMTADGAGLILAGHTHGGQLALPFFGAIVTNCDLDRGRAKGVSRWWPGAGGDVPTQPGDAAYLHVSAGLGTSPYAPVRFACRPEATLLTLMSR